MRAHFNLSSSFLGRLEILMSSVNSPSWIIVKSSKVGVVEVDVANVGGLGLEKNIGGAWT